MMRGDRRIRPVTVMCRFTIAAMTTAAIALAAPAGASAQSQLSVPLTPGDLLGQGLGATVAGLACDPLRKATQPFGDLAVGVSDLLCNAGVLDYSFYTVYKRPDGTLVKRETRTALLLPTLIEVGDGDLLPDLIGTITPLSLDRFKLRIDRVLLETGPLPLSIEAVANDPTSGTLPRKRIAFGYDARASRAPQSFEAEVRVGTSATQAGATTLSIGYDTRSPGTTLDVIGGLFNGAIGARTDPIGARLSYAPVPQKGGVDLVIGNRIEVRKTASSLTKLTADYEDVLASSETRMRAVVDKLPSWTEVVFDRIATSKNKVTYTSVAPVSQFTLDYTAKPGGVLSQAATVKASGLPTGMTVEQTSPKSGSFTATGGSVASVEAGYGDNGMPRLLAGVTKPYGYVYEDATMKSYAGRFQGLTTATFDGTEPIVVDATIAARTPFVFKVDTPKLKADGDLQDLPRKVHAFVDLDGGKIEYDGFGDTIDRITVAEATKPAGFFPASKLLNRVKRIKGEVRQLPPKVIVGLKPDSAEGAGFTASAPVGFIEALLTSKEDSSLPVGESGFKVEDLPDRITVFGRINGLKEVNVQNNDTTGKLAVTAKVARQKLHAIYDSILKDENGDAAKGPGRTIVDARLSEIPSDIALTLNSKQGITVYRANDGIDTIDATALAERPLLKRARWVTAHVEGIPKELDLFTAETPNGSFGAQFRAPQGVRKIEALASSDPNATVASDGLPAGESGFKYQDVPDRFTIFGRVNGLREVGILRLADATDNTEYLRASAKVDRQKLHAIYDADVKDVGHLKADARLSEVPDDITLSLYPKAGAGFYRAAQGIDTLDATLDGATPLFGRVKHIGAHIEGIPKELDLGFKPESGSGGSFNAKQGVDLIEVEMSQGAPLAADDKLPAGQSGAVLWDIDNKFTVFGRLRKVTAGSVSSTGSGGIDASVSTGKLPDGSRQSFTVEAHFDKPGDPITFPAKVVGTISALPEKVTISQRDARTDYTAEGEGSRVSEVKVNAENLPGQKLEGAIHNVEATLKGVPNRFSILNSTFGTGVDATLATDPFDRIDLMLWDTHPNPVGFIDFPEDGHNKATVRTRGGRLGVKLRVLGLKKATYSDFALTQSVKTLFGSPAAPLDVQLFGEEKKDANSPAKPTEVRLGAKELGKQADFEISSLSGTKIGYDADADTADVHAELGFTDVSALLDLTDIPRDTDVCIGKEKWVNFDVALGGGLKDCDGRSPSTFQVDDDDIGFDRDNAAKVDDFILRTRSSGMLTASGKVCLPPTNDDDPPKRIGDAPTIDACRFITGDCPEFGTTGCNYLEIDNLRLKDVLLEFASGDTESLEDDEPTDDDLLKLYLDSDANGISVNRLFLYNSNTEDLLELKTGPPHPLRNMDTGQPFFAVLDTDPSGPDPFPDLESWNGERLDCRNLFIDTDAPLVDDIVPILTAIPGLQAKKICFFG